MAVKLSHGYGIDGSFADYAVRTISIHSIFSEPRTVSSLPLQKLHRPSFKPELLTHPQLSYVDYVTPIPESLDSAAATPLLCAVSCLPCARERAHANTLPRD